MWLLFKKIPFPMHFMVWRLIEIMSGAGQMIIAQLLHNFLFLIFRYRDRYRDRYAKKLKLKFRVRVRFRNRNANWSGSGIGTFRSRIRHSCT